MLELDDAALAYGVRTLWQGLDLRVEPGEFVAVLGPNGTGKTSLFKVILGLTDLTHGSVRVGGRQVRTGNSRVGYIPQHRGAGAATVRARDLVRLGIDGHRWGLPLPSRSTRRRVDALLTEVGAGAYADAPTSLLSGGELQRLRVAQAVANDPLLLLCDEPLLTLDLNHQKAVVDLIDRRRRDGAAVLFVTHEINPVLSVADRVLYLVDGQFLLGSIDEVLTSANLTRLYSTPVEVVRSGDRLVVLGAGDVHAAHDHHLGHDPHGTHAHDGSGDHPGSGRDEHVDDVHDHHQLGRRPGHPSTQATRQPTSPPEHEGGARP